MGMPVITPGTISREESIGDVIESIANEEAAIAHILNAESEKLQKIINSSYVNAQDLLAANKSIKSTLDTIIGLEISLKAKLEMFKNTVCQTN